MEKDNYTKELAYYFDMLRHSRKMTLEELTSDIVSIRQFRRYMRGEYQMPATIFNQLATRLGFKPEHILLELEEFRLKETKIVNNLYNTVINKDFEQVDSIIKTLDPLSIIENNNKLIYQLSVSLKDLYQKKITDGVFIDKIKKLVDYDTIFDKHILSSTEVIILTTLLPISCYDEKDKVITLLEKFIAKQKMIVSGHNDRLILLCLYYLADYYGSKSKFEETIKFSQKGIEYCNYLKFYYLLHDFYYFASLAYHYLNDKANSDLMLFKCYCVLHSESNESKLKKYYKMIESDFEINFDEYISNYLINRSKK